MDLTSLEQDDGFRTASAVVPVYNGAESLPRCLRSLRRQNEVLVEIIVVDDGSRDATPAIVEEFARADPRIRVLRHSKNQGLAASLNEGICHATGDAILIIQDDCELLGDDWVEQGLRLLRTHQPCTIAGWSDYPIQEMNLVEKSFGLLWDTFYSPDNSVEELAFSDFKCDLVARRLFAIAVFDTKFRIAGEDHILSTKFALAGNRILRFHDLRYLQRFGKGSSLKPQLMREMRYGRAHAGIMLRTAFHTVYRSLGSRMSGRRLLGRASSILFVIGLLSCLMLLAVGGSPWLFLVPFAFVVARILLLASRWRGLRTAGGMNAKALGAVLLIAPIADLLFVFSLLSGFIAFVVSDRVQ